jgi:4-methylaminobutanoate oxidase (formaldehyde-forming)
MYGHTIGASIALATVTQPDGVTPAWIEAGRWEVEIARTRYAARASLRPFHDPQGARIRA